MSKIKKMTASIEEMKDKENILQYLSDAINFHTNRFNEMNIAQLREVDNFHNGFVQGALNTFRLLGCVNSKQTHEIMDEIRMENKND